MKAGKGLREDGMGQEQVAESFSASKSANLSMADQERPRLGERMAPRIRFSTERKFVEPFEPFQAT